jgi:hypothetical protein
MSEESRRVLAAWEERMISQLGEKGFQVASRFPSYQQTVDGEDIWCTLLHTCSGK